MNSHTKESLQINTYSSGISARYRPWGGIAEIEIESILSKL